ncbi:MAG: DNA mismatch repair endonuclease MutL [Planctomycetota bacterium]
MPVIRQLPVSLVNKIAAGEVIERPASVVKETVENSIDAGATHIEIAVEGGGIELIRIRDNGCGIDADQLELALDPHATSKLQTSEDLFDVRTLGFRGEALASIAEISHLSLRSRVAGSDSGYELRVEGGEREPIRPCAMDIGTTLEVRHLFFNTPVRRKFMKTPSTEMGHVTEAFTRIALAFPHVHMVLTSGDRMLYDLPPTERWAERIRAFFGDEVADALIAIEHVDEQVTVRGYVADPSVSRSNNRMQYLFLNGRYIRDRSLQHALGEAYRGLLMVGRMPVCFLHLELDPKKVDVNVHPTKVEVRFEDSGAIYSRLLHTLRHKFLTSDLVAKVRDASSSQAAAISGSAALSGNASVVAPSSTGTELMDWARHRPIPLVVEDPLGPSGSALGSSVTAHALPGRALPDFRPFPEFGRRDDPFHGMPRPTPSANPEMSSVAPGSRPWSADDFGDLSGTSDPLHHSQENHSQNRLQIDPGLQSHDPISGNVRATGFQIHDRYLVTQDDAGMVIIDQHALHERIMYEQIKKKVLSKSIERQRLLVPETVALTPSEVAAVIESQETLSEIGFDVEPFGGDTVLLQSYPSILAALSPTEMLKQALEAIMSGGKKVNARDVLDDLMNMMACKAAIKAGDRLSVAEISALLEQRRCYQDTHHCPHGRPTALFLSREQLDKMFKRT